jgi:thiamine-monophosphate kinase
MGEFEIIEAIRSLLGEPPGDVVVGPGDDCAVVRCGSALLLLTDDAMVEDVHFRRALIDPRALGRRAISVAVSDIAAMGGTPRWVLASVGAPPGAGDTLVEMAAGMAARCAELGATLVGGNLARSASLQISVTAAGTVDGEPLLRSGAVPGDLLALTGPVGGAALGLTRLLAGDESPLAGMWRDPPTRVEAGWSLLGRAHAAIDVSDGLLQDLGHVMEASGVGARIELARLPLAPGCVAPGPALGGGEDYELLVAIPPDALDGLACDLVVCGSFTETGTGLVLVHEDGSEEEADPRGWDHFGEA